jgi:LacI family transcriptional regulator, galactose operon repressor
MPKTRKGAPGGKTRRRMTTIQDIARELGISAMTVSRALNQHPDVKTETRERILALAAERRYRANRWARSLVTRRSQIIGVVIPDISHSFFSEITRGIQDVIEQQGYNLMLCHSHADAQRELQEIDSLVGSRVEGLIVASQQQADSPEAFRDLEQQGVPFVLIDRFFSNYDCAHVVVDDRRVAELAIEHLIELGHREIGHIAGPPVSSSLLRTAGYRATLKKHGLAVNEDWIASSDYQKQGGFTAMQEVLKASSRPTAMFATNDPAAIGAIVACRVAGLDIPGDISIVGAGCIEGSYHPNPFVTTVDWPRTELGARAAEMLLRLIAGEKFEERHVVLKPELQVRQSAAPPRK